MFSFTRTRTGEHRSETGSELTVQVSGDEPQSVVPKLVKEIAAHMRVLGLPPTATWEQATAAHRRLVADLTPGADASHSNVRLAQDYLNEVNQAYASLRMQSVA